MLNNCINYIHLSKLLYICTKFINNLNLNTMANFNKTQLATAYKILDANIAYSDQEQFHVIYKAEGGYLILDITSPIKKRYSINAIGEFKQLF